MRSANSGRYRIGLGEASLEWRGENCDEVELSKNGSTALTSGGRSASVDASIVDLMIQYCLSS